MMPSGRLPADSILRAAIIGCGQIAGGYDRETAPDAVYTHAKAYRLQSGTSLVAVADLDAGRAREFSAQWGNPVAYTDVSRMLAAESPDIVSICTPDDTHAAVLELCLDCPSLKAVWCEKPLTTDIVKAEQIVSAYSKRGIVLAVNYQRRWQPQMLRIKNALQRRDLGEVQKAVVYYSKGICHNGSHAIDLLLDWFGPPGSFQVRGSHVDFAADDPTVDALLQFGDIPVYLIGVDERAYSLFEIQILGTLGRVNVRSSGREVEWYRVQADAQFGDHRALCLQDNWIKTDPERAMAHVLQDMIKAVVTGQSVLSNGESALATLRVCCRLAAQATVHDRS